MVSIVDNFLDPKEFNTLKTILLGNTIDWHYNANTIYENFMGLKFPCDDNFQFIHWFLRGGDLNSSYYESLSPILQSLNPLSIYRIKANLNTRTPEIVENEFHVDIDISEEKLRQWTTSIFYMNTNNGYTEFQDGRIAMENTKVESVANRMVTFPANLRHRGTTCTDEKTRIVINFDYFTP